MCTGRNLYLKQFPGNYQGQVGLGFQQLVLVEGVPALKKNPKQKTPKSIRKDLNQEDNVHWTPDWLIPY